MREQRERGIVLKHFTGGSGEVVCPSHGDLMATGITDSGVNGAGGVSCNILFRVSMVLREGVGGGMSWGPEVVLQ